MQKNIYTVLSLLTVGLLTYTSYYTFTTQTLAQEIVPVAETKVDATSTKMFTTLSSKKILVKETNPVGESMSTLTLTSEGLEVNDPIVLEKNKLTDVFLADLNKDSFSELVIITTSQGSGSYGEATIFTTVNNKALTPVSIPQLVEEDMQPGNFFEGYMGHDKFTLADGKLIREFPTYLSSDLNDRPTGPSKKIIYTLVTTATSSFITFEKDAVASSTVLTQTATSTGAVQASTSTKALEGTSWVWTSTTGDGRTAAAPEGGKFTLTFGKNKTITGTTDCNPLTGTYASGPGTLALTFTQPESTAKTCTGSREGNFRLFLGAVTAHTFRDSDLILIIGSRGTMTFKNK